MRTWYPYTEWEDYQAGMFVGSIPVNSERLDSIALLSNAAGLHDAMMDVVLRWPVATGHNLSDTGMNRRAWLGQAACCLAHRAAQFATCSAWWHLTDDQRTEANAVADTVIARWESEVTYGAETLFGG